MLDRYTLPEMGVLWSEENKFQTWLEVEILACEARAELGHVPASAVSKIRNKAKIDVKRIEEIEKKTRHDMIAFLEAVSETVGEESKYIHFGLTSYDIEDTALSYRMVKAADLIAGELEKLLSALREKAVSCKDCIMMGRTHGMHAQPVTFGLKMALWLSETERNIERLKDMRRHIACGKLSGAVGTYEHCPFYVEKYVCGKLGLAPAKVSTQILQRDRHASFLSTLAIIAGSLEKFAVEIRNLQRTEIAEVEEPFRAGQKGSSAMPHKRNPIISERVCGLARIVRANALAGLENMALWHERDLTNSSAERIIIPDSSILVYYMLKKLTVVIKDMKVYPERMLANMRTSRGLVHSQKVLMALSEKGLDREKTYELVQKCAMRCIDENLNFKDVLLDDKEIRKHLSEKEIKDCFELESLIENTGEIYKRLGL
jgi:adenylosuccinate lyase